MWTHQQEKESPASTSLCSTLCLSIHSSAHRTDEPNMGLCPCRGCDGYLDCLHQPNSALLPMTLIPQGQTPTVPWARLLLTGWVTVALPSWLLLTRCLSLTQLAACSLARLMLLQGVQPWPTVGCDGWMDRRTDIQPWQGPQLPVSCLARLVGLCSCLCAVLPCHV